MILSLVACATTNNPTESDNLTTENADNNAQKDVTENTEQPNDNNKSDNEVNTTQTKILVAYFSATGTTKGVAESISEILNADIYEIEPKEPYTNADLDYNDKSSRSTTEMNDSSARPEIANSVDNMDDYSIVFIGYPIWWGDAPRIVSTFVESYDFSGKTIVPFCTSGGSGISASVSNLETLTTGANWLEGERLNGNASNGDIEKWINGLGIKSE
jgi:flavodoxin